MAHTADGNSFDVPSPKRQKLDSDCTRETQEINNGSIDTEATDILKKTEVLIESVTQLQEKDVGIQEYISKLSGFNGVIKQRFSDFLVNEISLDGKVVELMNVDLPCPLPDIAEVNEVTKDVSDLISEEHKDKLKELICSRDKKKSVLIEVGEDKEARAKIHKAIAESFPGLDSCTLTKENKKYIEAKITSNQGNGLRRWPKGRGDYCKFVLYKENKDTMDAVGLIAKQLCVKSGLFQYAGTKDRRAKTSQEVTVYRVAAEKLKNNNQNLRNIVTGNYSYVKEPLKLGQLKGNKFTIVLRSVSGSEDQIAMVMKSLIDVGFINYYGMQRFGTMSVPTHHIGRALLQGNWKEAVELILKPRSGDDKDMKVAREHWWTTRNSRETLAMMPKHAFIERAILLSLSNSGDKDYLGAINKLARNTRLMYVHSYQSYIWNMMASQRVKLHGTVALLGDLVIPHNQVVDLESDEGDVDIPRTRTHPMIVDESNKDQYSVYDVVLPLPGYDVIYPANDSKVMCQELMKQDDLDCEKMRNKHKDFSLSGAYRHILVKPEDVTWSLYKYSDVAVPLALSDWERMKGLPEPTSMEGGDQQALKLQLTLPPSCYATMALREVLKLDTSSTYQSSLNVC